VPRFIQAVVSNAQLQRLMHKIQTLCDYDQAALIAEFDDDERGVMPKDIFGTPTPIMYEGYEVLGVEKANEYLTRLFGNYMELPPEDKRRIHNFDYVDFEHSYHDYHDNRQFK
jgi:lipopolysaccharide cholinephosphotransferase